MNARQKAYDSTDEANKLTKINNNYYLYKNVEEIRKRKPRYFDTPNPRKPNKLNKNQVFKDYFVIKENLVVYNKIRDIMCRKANPQNNNYFILHENKSKEQRNKYKNYEEMKIAKENKYFQKRLKSQKSFLDVIQMEKEYQRGRKYGKKNSQAQSVVLPPINVFNPTKPTKNDENKNKCVTEIKKDEEQ